jgi:hypothetical protein
MALNCCVYCEPERLHSYKHYLDTERPRPSPFDTEGFTRAWERIDPVGGRSMSQRRAGC